jgi:hypothetical protein
MIYIGIQKAGTLFLSLVLVLGLVSRLYSQPSEKKEISPIFTNEMVVLDGKALENVWAQAQIADGFRLNYPSDLALATATTTVKLCYDQEHLYLYAECHAPSQKRYVRTLQRDFYHGENDGISLVIDPLLDNTNGFLFTVSARGSQSEAIIYNGNWTEYHWDNSWQSEVWEGPGYWAVEMRIPFRSLRFKGNAGQWGVNFVRVDIGANEISSWNPCPREFDAIGLNFTGLLTWPQPPNQSKSYISLIPYSLGGMQRIMPGPGSYQANAGMDAKLALSTSLNLDLSTNPDFSQAEADEQQINLGRFSLYFPERRNFFIENNDLFANFGFRQIRPFFSRRIGLGPRGDLVPIYLGARLSGKVNQRWRMGLLTVQTAGQDSTVVTQNYSVACFQRQIGGGNLGGIFVNKQDFDKEGIGQMNRVLGLDYNILSKNNRLRGKLFYHHSFGDAVPNDEKPYAHASWLMYSGRSMTYAWNHEYVGKGYRAEAGFVPREGLGYWRLEPWVSKTFYTKKGPINNHGPELYVDWYTNENMETTDRYLSLDYTFTWQNTSYLELSISDQYVKLIYPFNPNPADSLQFEPGPYHWNGASLEFEPAAREKFGFGFYGEYSGFYKGERIGMGGSAYCRLEPYLQIRLEAEANYLLLPTPYQSANLMLIRPRIDLSLSPRVFITGLVQVNGQTRGVSLNTRLQYRFKPMSDIFVVFNHNFGYREGTLVVFKMNYWINV